MSPNQSFRPTPSARLDSGVTPLDMQPGEPLKYPPHYPPTTRWKRFFIGVRVLGPDLSFFRELRASQSARTVESMSAWGGGERLALAAAVGSIFSKHCNWPSPYFLPGDMASVIAGGSTFGWLDETDVGDAIQAIEELVGAKMPPGFWGEAGSGTLGHLVDQLASAAGPNQSFKPTPSARLNSGVRPHMNGLKHFAAIELVALASLLAVAAAMAGYGAADSALHANSLLSPSSSAWLGFAYTTMLGAPAVAVIGAPTYFFLLQRGLAQWPYVLLAGAVPGLVASAASVSLGFWAILCGIAVAALTHAVYRKVGPHISIKPQPLRGPA